MCGASVAPDEVAEVKIKLKRIKITKLPPKYDVENITDEYTVDVKNMFGGLQLEDREPGEIWNDIREIVKDTADKMLSKAKRKNVSKWIINEAVDTADKRRKARNQVDYDEYRRLNAALQRRARKDNEMSLQEKCRQT